MTLHSHVTQVNISDDPIVQAVQLSRPFTAAGTCTDHWNLLNGVILSEARKGHKRRNQYYLRSVIVFSAPQESAWDPAGLYNHRFCQLKNFMQLTCRCRQDHVLTSSTAVIKLS